ncbi:MAG: TetR/AcrR family transcriptional regulator [Mycobacteriales bacterium]
MAPDRREVLADAAIEVIAAHGMRGLTHRAVDAEAGVPPGSTSYYFRTRQALIDAVVHRLLALDTADLAAAPPPAPGAGLEWIATVAAESLDRWLVTGRSRLLARYACMLEAGRDPALRETLAAGAPFRAMAADLLARAGAADADRAARDLVACVDGLLFDRLAGYSATTGPRPGTADHRAALTATLRALLAGLTTPDMPAPPGTKGGDHRWRGGRNAS